MDGGTADDAHVAVALEALVTAAAPPAAAAAAAPPPPAAPARTPRPPSLRRARARLGLLGLGLLGGPLAVALGARALLSPAGGDGGRAARVAAYDAAVAAWVAPGGGALAAAALPPPRLAAVSGPAADGASAPPPPPPPLTLSLVTTPDPLTVDAGLAPYAPRLYFSGVQPVLDGGGESGGGDDTGPLPLQPFPPRCAAPGSALAPAQTARLLVSSSLSPAAPGAYNGTLLDVPLAWCEAARPCVDARTRQQCAESCAPGRVTAFVGAASVCETFFSLAGVCLVLAQPPLLAGGARPALYLDDAPGLGFGCALVGEPAASRAPRSVTRAAPDARALGPYSFTAAPAPPAGAPRVSFSIRTAGDPFVAAMRLTRGAPGNFGAPAGGAADVEGGIALVALGVLVVAAVAAAAVANGDCFVLSTGGSYTRLGAAAADSDTAIGNPADAGTAAAAATARVAHTAPAVDAPAAPVPSTAPTTTTPAAAASPADAGDDDADEVVLLSDDAGHEQRP